jgi:hypothetical protein
MNFLGHTHVALATDDHPLYVLGAVLPDLASMAGVRIDRVRSDGPLHQGIRNHIDTDAVFHAHELFRSGSAAVRADLGPLELPMGAVRAIGHIGWELLLDGTLVATPVESAFQHAMVESDLALRAITTADHPRWRGFVARWKNLADPRLRYDEPGWVAERLHLMLRSRPRLAFPEDVVPAVTDVLAEHVGPVRAAAPDVLDAMVAASTG